MGGMIVSADYRKEDPGGLGEVHSMNSAVTPQVSVIKSDLSSCSYAKFQGILARKLEEYLAGRGMGRMLNSPDGDPTHKRFRLQGSAETLSD